MLLVYNVYSTRKKADVPEQKYDIVLVTLFRCVGYFHDFAPSGMK